MKDFLFERKCRYKSSMDKSDFESALVTLIKEKTGPDIFAGKLRDNSFYITPILGTRENFKISITGEIKAKANELDVDITYSVSPVLRFLVYLIFSVCIASLIIGKTLSYSFILRDIHHVDYILLGYASFFMTVFKIRFEMQFAYYSGLIEKLLYLEKID